ncbi:MAG: hypothetical protein ACREQV_21305, partial [Candidatus Binatia bacterium]
FGSNDTMACQTSRAGECVDSKTLFSGEGEPLREHGMMIAHFEATAGQITDFDGHGSASKGNAPHPGCYECDLRNTPRTVSVAKLNAPKLFRF